MNYLTAIELIETFKVGKVLTTGCISIWKDEMGKPGDAIYDLKVLSYKDKESLLRLEFTNCVVNVYDPRQITIESKRLLIGDASGVEWENQGSVYRYRKVNNDILATAQGREKVFNVSASSQALEYYGW